MPRNSRKLTFMLQTGRNKLLIIDWGRKFFDSKLSHVHQSPLNLRKPGADQTVAPLVRVPVVPIHQRNLSILWNIDNLCQSLDLGGFAAFRIILYLRIKRSLLVKFHSFMSVVQSLLWCVSRMWTLSTSICCWKESKRRRFTAEKTKRIGSRR